jgi:hypothetical protein
MNRSTTSRLTNLSRAGGLCLRRMTTKVSPPFLPPFIISFSLSLFSIFLDPLIPYVMIDMRNFFPPLLCFEFLQF